jgi:hypothetical protein
MKKTIKSRLYGGGTSVMPAGAGIQGRMRLISILLMIWSGGAARAADLVYICTPCPAGTYSDGMHECQTCGKGYYINEERSACILCDSNGNKYCPGDGTMITCNVTSSPGCGVYYNQTSLSGAMTINNTRVYTGCVTHQALENCPVPEPVPYYDCWDYFYKSGGAAGGCEDNSGAFPP